jgi:hypothetical protein
VTERTAQNTQIFKFEKASDYLPFAGMLAVMVIAATTEVFQGHVWWCRLGDMVPWSWNIWSAHNSQHLVDPYSFTHILHGVAQFWVIGLIFPRMPVAWRMLIAITFEGSWEIAENSTYVINRYREATISLDYFGDSIINSMSDIVCCATGFVIAYRLRFWRSLALFVATEVILILTIRDSLVLNLIMLIYPIDAIKTWQLGG